jgi:CBS domain-containing protein
MGTVVDVLSRKGRPALLTAPSVRLRSLAREMAEERMPAAVVIGETGAIAGIITEHELALAMSETARDTSTMLVGEFMCRKVVTCSPSDSDAELLRLMVETNTSCLPVVLHGKVTGIVLVGDVIASQMASVRRSVDRILQMTDIVASASGRFSAHLRQQHHDQAHNPDHDAKTRDRPVHRHG